MRRIVKIEMALLWFEVKKLTDKKERLDRYVAEHSDLSRSLVQKLVKKGRVYLNEKIVKSSVAVQEGDIIVIDVPEPEKIELVPEDMKLDVVYEDRYLLVVNKPQGLVVHPSKGHETGTLVHGLLSYCKDLSGIGGEIRPGIVHRLDRDTSGLLLVAKDDITHKKLSLSLERHEIERTYVAILQGRWEAKEGTIKAPIARHPQKRVSMAVVPDGREAITHFKVLHLFDKNTFIRLNLETGRTHQIRVHMNYVGYPILGDVIYNPEVIDKTLMLHAAKLRLAHPITSQELVLTAKLPCEFRKKLNELY